jgi:hypothetical protein
MIEHILDAELIKDPWGHLIVENVFSESDWAHIQEGARAIAPTISHGSPNLEFIESTKLIPQSTIEVIDRFSNELLQNRSELLKKLNNFEELTEYSMYIKWSMAYNSTNRVHLDKSYYAMSFTTYVSPVQALGTILYTSKGRDEDFHSVIEWKPNKGFIFAPIPDVSWHNYLHYGNEPRITLNFVLVKKV